MIFDNFQIFKSQVTGRKARRTRSTPRSMDKGGGGKSKDKRASEEQGDKGDMQVDKKEEGDQKGSDDRANVTTHTTKKRMYS
jgi:hypothetical protein